MCPQCSDKETWDHVVQCRNATSMRVHFILELHKDLKKVQVVRTSNEELRPIIEDIRINLREDTEDFETNQQAI